MSMYVFLCLCACLSVFLSGYIVVSEGGCGLESMEEFLPARLCVCVCVSGCTVCVSVFVWEG